MSGLYKRIKNRREELGLTQEELARKLGYKSRSSINKIEAGENDIPQSKVEAFAKALDTTVAYLMGWDSQTYEQDALVKLRQVEDLLAKATDEKEIAELSEEAELLRESYEDLKLANILNSNRKPLPFAGPDDDDLTSYLDELRYRPEMRMLFSVSKKASKEDVEKAVKIIEMLKGDRSDD